jgi:hypothetical protein
MKQNRLVRFGILIASIVFCLTTNAQAQVGWQPSGNNEYITNGIVGIGTTSPAPLVMLDVRGGVALGAGTPTVYAGREHTVEITGSAGYTPLAIIGGSSTVELWKDFTPTAAVMFGAARPGQPADGNFYFSTYANYSPLNLWPVRMMIANSTGNIGIGTTNPLSKLDISGGVAIGSYSGVNAAPSNGLIVDGNVGIGTTGPGAKLEVARPNDGASIFRISNVGGSGFDFARNNVTGALSIQGNQTGNNNILLAPTSGNVGIGTTTTGNCRLAVEGMIGAREVQVVASGWPDYVFDESYKLTPLDEVEHLIKINKHLPGIPSKEEVTKDGVKLGEMQTKLLQKVEELTLYVIEQNKRIEKLEKENQELSK